ncbi:MAG: flagellar biosynthesis/type III secretory pathway M-ring protein FliF/YscJ [Candidatus Omnitrophota bacterium]|jgi:flagellar biosynthesis/type III secretory pathway M-ring protein FliF/YscJ
MSEEMNDTHPLQDAGPKVRLNPNQFEDDFAITHPDEVMEKVRGGSLSTMLVLSIVGHLVLITILSFGFIRDAVHYQTMDPQAARAEEAKEQRLAEKQAKAAEAEQQRAEAPAKDVKPAAAPTVSPAGNGDEQSPIEKELEEISNERPESSGLDSIDDDF